MGLSLNLQIVRNPKRIHPDDGRTQWPDTLQLPKDCNHEPRLRRPIYFKSSQSFRSRSFSSIYTCLWSTLFFPFQPYLVSLSLWMTTDRPRIECGEPNSKFVSLYSPSNSWRVFREPNFPLKSPTAYWSGDPIRGGWVTLKGLNSNPTECSEQGSVR